MPRFLIYLRTGGIPARDELPGITQVAEKYPDAYAVSLLQRGPRPVGVMR